MNRDISMRLPEEPPEADGQDPGVSPGYAGLHRGQAGADGWEPEEPAGYTLDPEGLSAEEKLLNRCKERCLYLLSDAPKSESRLREKLRRSGKYPAHIIEEAIAFLKRYAYLDDRGYALRFIRQQAGKKSLREMEQKLCQRGIRREDFQAALEDFQERIQEDCPGDAREAGGGAAAGYAAAECPEAPSLEDLEFQAARALVEKKCLDPAGLSREEKRKLYAMLVRKGFSYETASRALRSFID